MTFRPADDGRRQPWDNTAGSSAFQEARPTKIINAASITSDGVRCPSHRADGRASSCSEQGHSRRRCASWPAAPSGTTGRAMTFLEQDAALIGLSGMIDVRPVKVPSASATPATSGVVMICGRPSYRSPPPPPSPS